jgi:GT2 family glycosyltransferase
MLAFGTAISDRDAYDRFAAAGISRAAEPGSAILTRSGRDSIQQPYNEMLEEAADITDLEALVLLHQDLELTDDSLPARLRAQLRDPRVGLVGLLGGRSTMLHLWTKTEDLYGTSMAPGVEARHSTGSHEVDAVDGSLLAIAPWAVRSLRFSEALADDFHGYDVDFSMRVRAAGGRVICDDIPYFHHMSPQTPNDVEAIGRAGVALARMWDPALRPPEWEAAFQR